VECSGHDADTAVDIRVTTTIAGHPALVAIECCDARRRDQLAWIAEPHGHGPRPVDKLVLVSRLGFSPMAATAAGRKGFELHALADALADPEWARGLAREILVPYVERAQVALHFELDPQVASTRGESPDVIVGSDALGMAMHSAWRRLREQDAARLAPGRPNLVDLARRARVRFGLPATLPDGVEYRVAGVAVAVRRVVADVTWWREAMFPEHARPLLLAAGVPSSVPVRAVTDVACLAVGASTQVTVVEDAEGQRLLVYAPRSI
jgi:hypothetical protein